MKIPRYGRQEVDNGLEVIGPAGPLGRRVASIGAALSLAQARALLAGEPTTFIVTQYDTELYRVRRDEHGFVHTEEVSLVK